MVKRILCMLLLALMMPCIALADNAMVVDGADLFYDSDVRMMEQMIRRIEERYQMDIVVLTTYDVRETYDDSEIQDYADLYFERNGYGMGPDDAGLLYMIDMTNRAPCISTSGVMIDYITDDRQEELFDISYDSLAMGRYGDAVVRLLQLLESFLEEGRLEGSFRYDAETGERLSGLYNALTAGEMYMALLIGGAAALIMYLTVNGRYDLKGGTYTYDAANNVSCKMVKNEEKFLRQTVAVVRHTTPSSGGGSGGGSGRGSSVHRSSSGRSHGGGVGRRF